MVIRDSQVSAAVAKASTIRGSDYAAAIAALGERLDEQITEVAELKRRLGQIDGIIP